MMHYRTLSNQFAWARRILLHRDSLRKSRVLVLTVMGLMVSLWQCGQTSGDPFRFIIRADPTSILANGRSTATITVEINSAQNPAGINGAFVNFVTTLGVVEPTARVFGNTARAVLRSGTMPGIATVTAVIGPSREQVKVQFLSMSGEGAQETKSISITGKNLEYYAEKNLVIASGMTRVRFRRMRLSCDVKLQYDVDRMYLAADGESGQNKVALSNGKTTLEGDRLRYDLEKLRGLLLKVNPQSERRVFSGDSLKEEVPEELPQGEEPPTMEEVQFPTVDNARGTVVVARQIVIYPGYKIKFRKARIYIDGKHVISLPLHVLPLQAEAFASYGIVGDQVFGFNSSGGFGLDFPFYYHVDAEGQGAIRLRHAGGDGFFTEAPGWSLAVQEDYSLSDSGTGTFTFDKLTRGNWGASVDHSQEFGPNTRGFFYASSPQHRDLFGRASFTRDFAGYSLGLETYGDAPSDADSSFTSQLYWQRKSKPLWSTSLDFSVSADLSYEKDPSAVDSEVVSQSLQVPLYFPDWRLSGRSLVTANLEPQMRHSEAGFSNVGVGASLALNQILSSTSLVTVSYTRSPGGAAFQGSSGTQYVSATFYSTPSRLWQFTSSSTLNLSDSSFFGSGTANFNIDDDWRLGLTSTYQRFYGDAFLDHDITVGHRLGKMEGTVGWSKARGHLYFQIGNFTF
ncbi:MAG: hypothetical protein HY318_17835 [Armatimonadetes bacterium]|nr:hypothetical protein [Armatimonadota bacterium]